MAVGFNVGDYGARCARAFTTTLNKKHKGGFSLPLRMGKHPNEKCAI